MRVKRHFIINSFVLGIASLLATIIIIITACVENGGMPERVKNIRHIADQVYKNDQGLWLAEFEGGHEFVFIPVGEFIMGSNSGEEDEKPEHGVYLDGYWLGKNTITYGQFKRFVDATGYMTDAEKGKGSWLVGDAMRGPNPEGNWNHNIYKQEEDHPVVSVSWYDAVAYCAWLSQKIGIEVELPTEAQWERAARGTDGRMFPWGNEDADGTRANFADIRFAKKYGDRRRVHKDVDDGFTETSPVGSYPAGASPYGLMDMAGNVWEWCYDYFNPDYYAVSPYRNPTGPSGGGDRVNRGGSFDNWSGYQSPEGGHNLRSAERTGNEPDSSDDHMGFRVCID